MTTSTQSAVSALTDILILVNINSDILYKNKDRVRLNSSLASGYIDPRFHSNSLGFSGQTSLPLCRVESTAPPTFQEANISKNLTAHIFKMGSTDLTNSTSNMTAVQKLRSMLADPDKFIACPGVYDGFTARIALQEGVDCLYMVSRHCHSRDTSWTKDAGLICACRLARVPQ